MALVPTHSNEKQMAMAQEINANPQTAPSGAIVCVFVFFYHPNNPVHGSAGERSMEISSMARRVSNFDVRGHPVGLSQTK